MYIYVLIVRFDREFYGYVKCIFCMYISQAQNCSIYGSILVRGTWFSAIYSHKNRLSSQSGLLAIKLTIEHVRA